MAYSPKSQKTYNQKCNRINLKYTEKELLEYNRLKEYCKKMELPVNTYIKDLIKRDLDRKGIAYTTDQIDIDIDTE